MSPNTTLPQQSLHRKVRPRCAEILHISRS